MPTVAQYLAKASPEQKAQFERLRKIVRQVAPDAEETISYGIVAFKSAGKYILYFGIFKNHMSIFPGAYLSQDKLEGYKVSKGTIQFTPEKPVPEAVIKEIIQRKLTK